MRKGRFDRPASELAQRFSESVSFDHRLYAHDIAGSIAHAKGLAAAGIITPKESNQIAAALREIEHEIRHGKFEWNPGLEDVHMNIETALSSRIGAAGAKIHTARSRNDQIALDLRLYVKKEVGAVSDDLVKLQTALLDLADQHRDLVMPGYTHLQRAQPIYFGHHLLAQIEAFARDIDRLDDCRRRVDVLPLGSGALAGSTIVLDRELIARELGFSALSQNSLDAVGDRDFICEFLFCLALIGTHISRLSEDFILWSTSEFGFLEFSDSFATGSSLMPQKKNPDMAELARGKTGRLYGNLVALLTTLKGLPTSYNRDLQEDKEPLFDSVDTIHAILEVFTAMLGEVKIHGDRMESFARDPALLATDLAEYLVMKGVPFRDAHEAVGRLVTRALEKNTPLDRISLTEMKEMSPVFAEDAAALFNPRHSLEKRRAPGSPASANVTGRLAYWRKHLGPRR